VFAQWRVTIGMLDVLAGLKNRVLDAATYELLRRNFELLDENNAQLKDKVEFQKEEIARLKAENLRLHGDVDGLSAELDMRRAETTFIVREGVAFRKDLAGKIQTEPYCPKCHEILSTVDHSIYMCGSCPYTIHLRRSIEVIAKSLEEERA